LENRVILTLLIFFLFYPHVTLGQGESDFYVSPSGDDSNSGSLDHPFHTIENGIKQLTPGDTLILREGTYSEPFRLMTSGTPEDYITIQNYPGEKPIIDADNTANNGVVISASHWRLTGLEIRNCNENGIWVESSQYFSITNCTVRNVQYGIGIADGSHDFTVENCLMTEFMLYGFDASPSGRDCFNGLIKNCIAYSGLDHQQNVDGFATGHGDQTGFTFINCTAVDVYDGFDISSDDTLLLGCLSVGCWNAGYKIWGDNVTLINCIGYNSNTNLELDWSGTPKTVYIYNSDFVQSTTFNIWIENRQDRLHLYNSIVAGGENIGLCFENGYSESYRGNYNLFHNWNTERMTSIAYETEYSIQDLQNNIWSSETGQDTNSITLDNLEGVFIGLQKGDLYPTEDSPLIDSGDPSKRVGLDFDFNQRENQNPPDIGAYEYTIDRRNNRIFDYYIPEPEQQHHINENNQSNNNTWIYVLILSVALILVLAYSLLRGR
jgi:parallel beta-helix repeat protein